MIFDDHDVHDDWMTSAAWHAQMRAKPWWHERIVGAFMSYWLYQHLGNVSPTQLRDDDLYAQVRRLDDAEAVLREFAARADRSTAGHRWSYCRELGRTRLVVIDSRAGRDFGEGRREMLDADEWRWLEEQARGGVDHLLLATSLPLVLPAALDDLEAWNAAVCAGAWGCATAWIGERLRRLLDLEHWAAFPSSARRLRTLIAEVAGGERGRAPASVVILSGDVHYAYLARLQATGEPRWMSAVYQAVCSPLRNPLPRVLRLATRLALTRFAQRLARRLASSVDAADHCGGWVIEEGPSFANQLATLTLDGRRAGLRLERPARRGSTALSTVFERELVGRRGDADEH